MTEEQLKLENALLLKLVTTLSESLCEVIKIGITGGDFDIDELLELKAIVDENKKENQND